MDHSKIFFSALSNDQVQDLRELENKLNSSNSGRQETVLIAYVNPK